MKESRVGRTLKEFRESLGKSQELFSRDVLLSRESLSKQENGQRKIQPGLTSQFTSKYNNPWLALEAANEYIGWGITSLDGPAARNDRYFLQLILEKELLEAIKAIPEVKLTEDSNSIQSMELQDIRRSVKVMARVVHYSTLYMAMLCDEYNISWLKIWKDHNIDLKSNGYVSSES
ncbi:transcriptional regulator [Halobacillus halophilus]|uniref:HTH domain protein n=1 Tax=Halobacillus halophilus (strain ATCC 35676 / DSM 2266 / JCM 20832 / KCTC 3685 / LMG 17431 / NBRC 102448 / NCIMB 2269) TaxID=866895 RepID=I0JIM7_HALH3|nr:helix-turn-helix transcriptional regulator [Halobacillus halophilus]ASF38178.1 transcriptional regulator [Halobacillus halophilus]CCG43995.1 HTH domain protein [Halobacillus halophilus DSM 2266]